MPQKEVWKLIMTADDIGTGLGIGKSSGGHGDANGYIYYDYPGGFSVKAEMKTGKILEVNTPFSIVPDNLMRQINALMCFAKENITVNTHFGRTDL